jgi:hypothetical protein
LFNRTKGSAAIALILLASILAAMNPYIACVKAQSQATVNISQPIGGSIDPQPGTYNYNDGNQVTLTATPDIANSYTFFQWVISTDASNDTETSNPFTLTVTAGVTYDVSAEFLLPTTEPIFPSNAALPGPAQAILVILHTVGGHTSPPEGQIATTDLAPIKLTAIPDSGWTFDHWVISGCPVPGVTGSLCTATSTDNPINATLTVGYTYAYQPVFDPVSGTTLSSPTPIPTSTASPGSTMGISNETWITIILAVALVIVLITFGAYAYTKRSKK